MKVKYDEYIIKCTYKELMIIRSALRSLEYDYKTHRFNPTYETEVTKILKKLHDVQVKHAEQYNKQTTKKRKTNEPK
tara:strand:- start:28275 stop:28505 length:231 start_codon:yes stop_codon:yes gene_type:complete